MRRVCFGWFVFCGLTAILGCRTPSVDWNGTWRANSSKSNFQGPIVTISISADGEYRYDYVTSSITFRCDGKDRQVGNNATRACVKRSDTVLDLIRKDNRVKTSAFHWELSAGGKVLTLLATAFGTNGPVSTDQIVYSRLSGSSDFVGHWRNTSYLQKYAEMTMKLDNQALHIGYPNAGQYIDAALDGVDTADHGPHAQEGATSAVRAAGNREFHTVTKRHDKVLTQGSLELSKDGRTITDTWWIPDQPSDKSTLVYEKQ